VLDIAKGAREDEREHFHLMRGAPTYYQYKFGPFRKTVWRMPFMGGSYFTSYWFWKIQFYTGNCKVDGTRTTMYWLGQLDDGGFPPYISNTQQYVVTTHPKEMKAFRFRRNGPGEPAWNNMGNS
jgi:hypothetical protein